MLKAQYNTQREALFTILLFVHTFFCRCIHIELWLRVLLHILSSSTFFIWKSSLQTLLPFPGTISSLLLKKTNPPAFKLLLNWYQRTTSNPSFNTQFSFGTSWHSISVATRYQLHFSFPLPVPAYIPLLGEVGLEQQTHNSAKSVVNKNKTHDPKTTYSIFKRFLKGA